MSSLNFEGNNPEANQKRQQAQMAMEGELKTMFGEQRYAEYQRSRDWQYRNLTQLARANGLPADTAGKAYDMNQLAMQEAAKIRSQPDLLARGTGRDARGRCRRSSTARWGRCLDRRFIRDFNKTTGAAAFFISRGRPAGGSEVLFGFRFPCRTLSLLCHRYALESYRDRPGSHRAGVGWERS